MRIRLFTNWLMYAEYADGHSARFSGADEDECMWKIAKACECHGDCTCYTGVNDEHYVDGEYTFD